MRIRRILLLAAVLLAPCAARADAPGPDPSARKAWDEVRDVLSEIAERQRRHDALPDPSVWHPVRTDKKDNMRAMEALMAEALSHLEVAGLTEHRQKYSELEEAIKQKKAAIGDHMDRRVGAPDDASGVGGLWTMTRADHDEKIARLKAEIAECETRQAEVAAKMRGEMKRMGMAVTDEQMANLLLVVSGDTFLDLCACFHNVKSLTDVVAGLIQENDQYVENSRRYYGMYVSLVKILLYAHQQARLDIEDRYIPQIQQILEETEHATAETRDLIARNAADTEAVARLKRNLDAQLMVRKAGASYLEHLRGQLVKLDEAEGRLAKHYEVALNTYQTVNIASGMLNIVRKSLEDFSALQSMELPDMLPLETDRVREQFEIISDQIRNE